jgi:predicted urease superfamily metal-dependent hydrolase
MKSYKVPAEVFEILKKVLASLDKLCQERDAEIDEALEEFTERKFAKVQQIKKKYNLKIKLAEKSNAQKT